MLLPGFAVYDYAILISDCGAITGAKYGVFKPLESGRSPMEAKGHHRELEEALRRC